MVFSLLRGGVLRWETISILNGYTHVLLKPNSEGMVLCRGVTHTIWTVVGEKLVVGSVLVCVVVKHGHSEIHRTLLLVRTKTAISHHFTRRSHVKIRFRHHFLVKNF